MAKSVMIEGAELLEIFQWKNYTVEEINADKELKLNIKKELADVMIYAIELAVLLDIDVNDAVRYKLEHNRKKYTVEGVTDKNLEASSSNPKRRNIAN
jgi:NTP pyrophosphatase (non-canonical NTP hydrolase)